MKTPEFLENTTGLLRPGLTFDPLPAWERVRDNLVAKLLSVKQDETGGHFSRATHQPSER